MNRKMLVRAVVFVAVLAASLVAHDVGDYYVQTSHQALRKGRRAHADHAAADCVTTVTCAHRQRSGVRACAGHVASYTATQLVILCAVNALLGLGLSWRSLAAGQLVSAGTHYFMDRRWTAEKFHTAIGQGEFHHFGVGLASGAAHLDRTWHKFWLLVAALVTAVLAER